MAQSTPHPYINISGCGPVLGKSLGLGPKTQPIVVIAMSESEHGVERRPSIDGKSVRRRLEHSRLSGWNAPKTNPRRISRSQWNMVRKAGIVSKNMDNNRTARIQLENGQKRTARSHPKGRSNKPKKRPVSAKTRLDRTRFLEPSQFKIATLNVWGLRTKGKREELEQFLRDFQVHIGIITESHLLDHEAEN